MGVDFKVYVGPYLEIQEPVTVTVYDPCEGHDRRAEHSFCPKCGRSDSSPRESIDGPLEEGLWDNPRWIDTFIDVGRTYNQPIVNGRRKITAIPNTTGVGLRLRRGSDTGARNYPGVGDFMESAADGIRRIRELGCTVEVKQGVVAYYS